ncbi:hypothetical protein NEIFLAOT_02057 [Neisseria flavescens NRL30031/H210]|uniref:Uncharacterized protein n=1 Tax=Neisseria flavescens NRL30031/H210 TaxID=546264 RepID=C0EQ16_NEIFL|nr:hypothetical protein NEIFLAOT_02057 [Neisseria flavescens NRL30031/H210]
MTADTVSPTKPISRLSHLKIPFLCPKQRPSETSQTACALFPYFNSPEKAGGESAEGCCRQFPRTAAGCRRYARQFQCRIWGFSSLRGLV